MSDQVHEAVGEKLDGRGATGLDKIKVPTAAELRLAGVDEFDEIKDNTFLLLRKRLAQAVQNPGRQGRIEDTHLISLATNLLKIDATRRRADGSDPDGHRPQVVNITNLVGGLPPARAAELLVTAIQELESAGRSALPQREALAGLVGVDETARLLAIEA